MTAQRRLVRRFVGRSVVVLPALLGAAALIAAACGDGDDGGGESASHTHGTGALADALVGRTLTLALEDVGYGSDALTIDHGSVAEITFSNRGTLVHDFTIDRFPGDFYRAGELPAGHEQHASMFDIHLALEPGASGTLRLRASEAGRFVFYCTVPGHREAGMRGVLVVR